MKRTTGVAIALGLAMIWGQTAQAIFVPGEPVPVNRLIRNVGEEYKRTPKDADVIYTLGRLHSLAFANGEKPVAVIPVGRSPNDPRRVPSFAPYSPVRPKPDATLSDRKPEALGHLKMSLALYAQAVKLKPKEALYWFSDAWMLEQGADFASEINAPFLSKAGKASKSAWRAEALKAYRKAFALSREKDSQRDHILQGADTVVSVEAGQSILDINKMRTLTAAETAEKAQIEAHLKKIQLIPQAVTPLIFPIGGQNSLVELTRKAAPVRFPLSGEKTARLWEWVTPNAGILVWDPKQTGNITSGRQLFGSVTWWMFWKNGFEPLAALDDNRDGWLDGKELQGIAVWQDKNGNGRSDAGEVTPVAPWGVKRIVVHAEEQREGVWFHRVGIVLSDGTTRPLYDWMPKSRE